MYIVFNVSSFNVTCKEKSICIYIPYCYLRNGRVVIEVDFKTMKVFADYKKPHSLKVSKCRDEQRVPEF